MSRTYEEKAKAWKEWTDAAYEVISGIEYGYYNEIIILVGYEHQCGCFSPLHSLACLGCHFEITHPKEECKPLFKIEYERKWE